MKVDLDVQYATEAGAAAPLPTVETLHSWVNAALTGFVETAELTVRIDRKSTRLNSSHIQKSRMPSSA